MDLVLYKNYSLNNVINKNLATIATLSAEQSVMEVNDYAIQLRYSGSSNIKWDNCNYFRWDGAYYYLSDCTYQANGVVLLNGTLDLLMTYRTFINNLKITVSRSSTSGSGRAIDENRLFSVDSEKTVLPFPNLWGEKEEDGVYVMTTSQSGYHK